MHGMLAPLLSQATTTLPLAEGSLILNFWNAVWPYLAIFMGFSIIVFVHELGHFLVAKWADVKVERFAVGFGRELFGFTRGETRYSFNILPLGGYVKMLGQEDFDDKSNELKFKDDPRSFMNKAVGPRMAIVSAGVIMNVIFAFILFAIVFMLGIPGPAPRVARVESDSPADLAGVLPGDRIVSIDDRSIRTFNDVSMAVFLSPPHQDMKFVVERNGEEQTLFVEPESRRPEDSGGMKRQIAGIESPHSREIAAIAVQTDKENPLMPKPGDMLAQVNGIEVTSENVNQLLELVGKPGAQVLVEREVEENGNTVTKRVPVDIPPLLGLRPADPRDRSSVSVLGLTPLVRFAFVRPGGRADLAGIEDGDTVLEWDDIAYPNADAVSQAIRDFAEQDIHFVVRKPDGRRMSGFVRPELNKKGNATIAADCRPLDNTTVDAEDDEDAASSQPRAHFATVRPHGPADRAGLKSGDIVLAIDGNSHPSSVQVNRAIFNSHGDRLKLLVRQPGESNQREITVVPRPPGTIDGTYALIADDVLIVGESVATIDGDTTPAAEAGIPRGAQITHVNEQTIATWPELISAFTETAGSVVQLGYKTPKGAAVETDFRVPHSIRTMLGVGPEAHIVSIDGRSNVEISIGRRTRKVPAGYPAGTRALLNELVGRKGVAVEYRENPFTPIKTATIDVTADMTDPWLGRVLYEPNIALYPETTLVKASNPIEAVTIGIQRTWYVILSVYQVIERMVISRSVGVESISGPLGIVSMGGQVARQGFVDLLFLMAIISANLAVINFLPLPIVDGGLMVFLIIEKIKGSPVSLRVQVATQMIGLVLIIGAFVFVTWQDAARLLG